jgi:hypothetical protein
MDSNIKQQTLRAILICTLAGLLCSALVLLLKSPPAYAAIERTKAGSLKLHQYIQNGVVIGGEAGTAFTLLKVRHLPAPKDKLERLFLDFGDAGGAPLRKRVGFYQVQLDADSKRLVIDLSQMSASGVTVQSLRQTLAKSQYVQNARILFDPSDSTITIQLDLKKRVQLEVFELPGQDKASRIAIDLKEKS